jgi:hypothetical protein
MKLRTSPSKLGLGLGLGLGRAAALCLFGAEDAIIIARASLGGAALRLLTPSDEAAAASPPPAVRLARVSQGVMSLLKPD